MALFFLISLTAIYLIRPNEWVPGLESVPLFLLAILPCIAPTVEEWSKKLTYQSLRENPITPCVAALLVSTLLSQIVNAPGELATTIEFSKACIFYLLIVAILNTEQRIDKFLPCLGLLVLLFASLIVLQSKGMIDTEGQAFVTEFHGNRASAFGSQTFSDPNDTALMLIIGFLVSLHLIARANRFFVKAFWILAIGVLIYALKGTESRAGFLALSVGACVYVWLRWGAKRLIWLLLLSPLVVAKIATSRMVDTGAVSGGTGQERVQLWHTALVMTKENPIFGIGPSLFTPTVGKASHNSFLQAYAELGVFGGTFFAFAFFGGIATAWQTFSKLREEQLDGSSNACLIVALLVSYALGIATLNHVYNCETYLVLGIATSCLCVERQEHSISGFPWKDKLYLTMFVGSCVYLVIWKILAGVLVNW